MNNIAEDALSTFKALKKTLLDEYHGMKDGLKRKHTELVDAGIIPKVEFTIEHEQAPANGTRKGKRKYTQKTATLKILQKGGRKSSFDTHKLLNLLKNELSTGEIVTKLKSTQVTVSKYLKELQKAGKVKVKSKGTSKLWKAV